MSVQEFFISLGEVILGGESIFWGEAIFGEKPFSGRSLFWGEAIFKKIPKSA